MRQSRMLGDRLAVLPGWRFVCARIPLAEGATCSRLNKHDTGEYAGKGKCLPPAWQPAQIAEPCDNKCSAQPGRSDT